MKVIIHNHDRIKKISSTVGTEVGSLPKGVGLERIRWTGSKIVDLVELSSIWVERKNGAFVLHAIKIPYSQLVQMEYKDRKKLCIEDGIFKIKSDEQIQTELNLQYRRSHYPLVSDQMGALMNYIKTLPNLPEELQLLVDKIEAVKIEYPKTIVEVIK